MLLGNKNVPPVFAVAADGDVQMALARELAELRDALDRRTGQCLEYRALALELDEALKASESRVEELEGIIAELQGQRDHYQQEYSELTALCKCGTVKSSCGPDCPGDYGDYCAGCGIQVG